MVEENKTKVEASKEVVEKVEAVEKVEEKKVEVVEKVEEKKPKKKSLKKSAPKPSSC